MIHQSPFNLDPVHRIVCFLLEALGKIYLILFCSFGLFSIIIIHQKVKKSIHQNDKF